MRPRDLNLRAKILCLDSINICSSIYLQCTKGTLFSGGVILVPVHLQASGCEGSNLMAYHRFPSFYDRVKGCFCCFPGVFIKFPKKKVGDAKSAEMVQKCLSHLGNDVFLCDVVHISYFIPHFTVSRPTAAAQGCTATI